MFLAVTEAVTLRSYNQNAWQGGRGSGGGADAVRTDSTRSATTAICMCDTRAELALQACAKRASFVLQVFC